MEGGENAAALLNDIIEERDMRLNRLLNRTVVIVDVVVVDGSVATAAVAAAAAIAAFVADEFFNGLLCDPLARLERGTIGGRGRRCKGRDKRRSRRQGNRPIRDRVQAPTTP